MATAEVELTPAPVTEEKTEDNQEGRKLAEGTAPVKSEFIDYNHKRVLAEEYLPKDLVAEIKEKALIDEAYKQSLEQSKANGSGEEPAPKRQKLKGRYKTRPNEKKPDDADKMCHAILNGQECRFGEKCKFEHNVKKYLDAKPPDVGETCFMFTTYGRCPYGLACRYGSSHIADEKNVVNEKLHAQYVNKKFTCNSLSKSIQTKLRKRKYDFKKANSIITNVIKSIKAPPNAREFDFDDDADVVEPTVQSESNETSEKTVDATEKISEKENSIAAPVEAENSSAVLVKAENSTAISVKPENTSAVPDVPGNSTAVPVEAEHASAVPVETSNGDTINGASAPTNVNSSSAGQDNRVKLETISTPNDEEGIKLRPMEKKKVDFRDKLYLAPLTTVGNLPFRRVCKKYGVDITCGEMAMSTNLLQGKNSEWALLRRHESEDLFGVQLCGSFPDSMARCGQLIMEQAEVDFIDINCGCPIDLVFKKGGGCALMSRMYKFEQIVKGMTSVLDVPLTIKMRTGVFEDKSTAHKIIPRLRDWGVSMVTIHGRSREQRYTRLADWEYINLCAQAGKPMPIYGNGDIMSFEEANVIKSNSNVSGLMLARGALIKPWVFTEIKEQRHWDISASERFDMLKDFVNFGLEHWGSDTQGVANVRRFLLEWLSFLYRYIPVGLLERLPQKINEKPPYFFGRNDLETMMGSPNCADWVRLSEMLLGPVPDSFTFIPKHKANAYK